MQSSNSHPSPWTRLQGVESDAMSPPIWLRTAEDDPRMHSAQ